MLYGREFQEKWYRKVMKMCCLDVDLMHFDKED